MLHPPRRSLRLYVIAGVPKEQADAGEPAVGQYNTLNLGVYNTMLADGNPVLWADLNAWVNTTIDYNGGTQATGDSICGKNSPTGAAWNASWLNPLHPGDGGQCHMYEAVRLALPAHLTRQVQVADLYAGPWGTISSSCSRASKDGTTTTGSRACLYINNPVPAANSSAGGGQFFGVGRDDPWNFSSLVNAAGGSGSQINNYWGGAAGTGTARMINESAGLGVGDVPTYYNINDSAPLNSKNWDWIVDQSGNWILQTCTDTFSSCTNVLSIAPITGIVTIPVSVASPLGRFAQYGNSQSVTITLQAAAGSTATLGGTGGCFTGITCSPQFGWIFYTPSGSGLATGNQVKVTWSAALNHNAGCLFQSWDGTTNTVFPNVIQDATNFSTTSFYANAFTAPTTAHFIIIIYHCE